MRKSKTPTLNKTVLGTNKCVIPLEPLVFNGNSGTPMKRRASRSIPDESSVTSKKSRGNQSAERTKGPVNSPRQRYGMSYDVQCVVPENIHTSPMVGIFSNASPPLWKFQESFIHSFIFFIFQIPPSPRKFQSLLWGEYGYFLELHNTYNHVLSIAAVIWGKKSDKKIPWVKNALSQVELT